MQRGQHQVAGQRGLDGDLRGLEVADFADHDHIRVLAQDGAQGLGEGQVDLGVDLGLPHAGQLVLDGVLHRHDVAVAGVHARQCRIQRGGLARARGAGDQHDAVRLGRQVGESPQRLALHAHGLQAELALALVQQAQHGALAVGAGQGGDAHVDGARAQAQADAAVLGQALFGDVQVGHDLQSRDQRCMQCAVGLHDFAQVAVHAKAHAGMALVGLDVDVAGAVARGLREQGVEHADDGRVVGRLQQVLDRRQLLHHAREVGVGLDLADHQGSAGLALRVGGADAVGQRARVQHLPALHRMPALDFGQGLPVGRGAVPEQGLVAVVLDQ